MYVVWNSDQESSHIVTILSGSNRIAYRCHRTYGDYLPDGSTVEYPPDKYVYAPREREDVYRRSFTDLKMGFQVLPYPDDDKRDIYWSPFSNYLMAINSVVDDQDPDKELDVMQAIQMGYVGIQEEYVPGNTFITGPYNFSDDFKRSLGFSNESIAESRRLTAARRLNN